MDIQEAERNRREHCGCKKSSVGNNDADAKTAIGEESEQLGGVIGLAVILSRGLAGQFTREHHVAVAAVHYYWHFVDVIWVLLFLVLYVMK